MARKVIWTDPVVDDLESRTATACLSAGGGRAVEVVELDEAKGSPSDYARRNRRHGVVVTRRGKPVSALLPLERGADLEQLSLSVNPRFHSILERARAEVRAGKVLSSDEVRRTFAQKRKAG